MTIGTVLEAHAVTLGDQLVADTLAGATVLVVDDVIDFNLDGGTLVINGQTIDYTAAFSENNVIALSVALAADAAVGDRVDVWYPAIGAPAVEYRALIDLPEEVDEGDALLALIDHALVPLMPLGIRDPGTGESVTLTERVGQFWVTNINGKTPQVDGAYMMPASIPAAALSFTVGGTTVTFATVAPSNPKVDDLWYDTSPADGTAIMKRWNGAAWVAVTFDAGTLLQAGTIIGDLIAANVITGDKFATQVLLATTAIIAGDPAGGRTQLGAEGFDAFNPDGKNTVHVGTDGSASFTGEAVSVTNLQSSSVDLVAGNGGGLFMYGSDPAASAPLNANPDFAVDITGWTADGTVPTTLSRDTTLTYNGGAASMKMVYNETATTGLLVGQATSAHVTVQPSAPYTVTLAAWLTGGSNVSIVLDYFNSTGTKIDTEQSTFIVDTGTWQTVSLASLAPSTAATCTIKAFGRCPDTGTNAVNVGFFGITQQSAPITLAPVAGTDTYGNTYPAGLRVPAINTDDLQVSGAIRAGGINAPVVIDTPSTVAINSNPEFATSATGWTGSGGNGALAWAAFADNPSDGRGDLTWDGTAPGTTPFIVGPSFPVTAGSQYNISAQLFATAAAMGGYAGLVWENSSGGVISRSLGNSISGSGWVISSITGTAPTGATQAHVRISWSATPNQIGTPASGQHLYIDYARVSTGQPGIMSFSPGDITDVNNALLAPKGLYLPPGYKLNLGAVTGYGSLSGIHFEASVNLTTTGGVSPNNGIVTVTHNAGFTPDWVDINKLNPNSGVNHWTGFFITDRGPTTFTMIAFGGDSSARLTSVPLTFDFVCMKF